MRIELYLEYDYEKDYLDHSFKRNINWLLSQVTEEEDIKFLKMLERAFYDSHCDESEDEEAAREFLDDVKKHLKKNKFAEVSYSDYLESTNFDDIRSRYHQRYSDELSIYCSTSEANFIIILDPTGEEYRLVSDNGIDTRGSYKEIRQAINKIFKTEILPEIDIRDYY